MFQWRSARRTSGEKEGTWQKKVPSICRGGEGLHFICTPTHTLCQWCELVFHSHCTSTPWTIGIPPPLHPPTFTPIHPPHSTSPILTSTPFPIPPTHVDVHPQYAVGGPVLVQRVPTSHFGLRVEQEVVRKPEDQQWITGTANINLKHIPCTIQHIQTNTVLLHTMCFVLRAWRGLQYEDTAHPPTTLLTHDSTTHITIVAVMLTGGPVVFPSVCGGCPSPVPPPCSCCCPLAVVEAPRVSGG